MKNFIILFGLLIITGCSETPTDVPVGTILADVELRVDMNSMITGQGSSFDASVDVLKVLLDGTEEYEMTDDDNDNIFNCIITNLILSRTYSYQYMINDVVEDLERERSFTVLDDNNILDYYGDFQDVELRVDMNSMITGQGSSFDASVDVLKVLLDGTEEYEMTDDDNDNIFNCIITNLILSRTYSYQYMINDEVEDIVGERSFTVLDDNNILDYYAELNPTTLKFLVDMSYQIELGNFSQAVNSINIVGNLNGWAGEEMVLSDGDEGVYQILITDIEIGDEIIYKFRIDSNDWESPNPDLSSCIDDGYGGSNRFHVVEEGEHILNHQFNDEYGD